jgi:hypothetical protein
MVAAAGSWLASLGGAAPEVAPLVPVGPSLAWRPATLVGAVAGGLLAALFVAVFLPLADPATAETTARSAARDLAASPLRLAGRARYAAEGCGECHTQRVRAAPPDAELGPPGLRGDYGAGPALAGDRRLGPDLMWIGDRHPAAADLGQALTAAHGPDGAVPLAASTAGDEAAGALVDYLLGLRSGEAR